MKNNSMFIIYDERARLEGPDVATVLDTALTLEEARKSVRDLFPSSVIYKYKTVNHRLEDGKLVE